MKTLACLTLLFLLAACGTEVISETEGTFTSDRGNTYPTIERTFRTEDGRTYSRTTIVSGAERVTCVTGDAADCNTALSDRFIRTNF